MLIIAGHVYVDPANIEEFVADARANIAGARAQPGCLFFSFALDDPADGSMLVLERWRDQEALDAYLARPEVVAVFEKWAGRMTSEVRKFDGMNERSPMA
jgi:quinol monooxygenase YgiN